MTGPGAGEPATIDERYPIGPFAPAASLTQAARDAAIGRIEAFPERLGSAVAGLPDPQLDVPYREGGWSVRQMTHHLADSHLTGFARMRLALTADQPAITPFDQDAWAALGDRRLPLAPSLRILEGIHRRWSAMLRALPPAAFARTVAHAELGVIDLDFLLQLYAWHGDHHVTQIERLRRRLEPAA